MPKLGREIKTIVAGGRDFTDSVKLAQVLDMYAESKGEDRVSIVSGMARGADKLAYEFAAFNHVTCYEFPAYWDQYGKRAGFVRNEVMADFADELIAFWDGKSKGTKHMIETMTSLGKPVHVFSY